MATYRTLEYSIHLTDKEQAAALAAQYPDGILLAPTIAATTYSAPIIEPGAVGILTYPAISSPWFVTNSNYPRNATVFSRKSGGWFGLSFLFGTTTNYKWIGKFVYSANVTPEIGGTATEIVAIAQRRFAIGFEAPSGSGEMASAGDEADRFNRAASRHADGLGYRAFCSQSEEIAVSVTASGGAATTQVWDRFYFKIVVAPNQSCRIWRVKCALGASRGAALYLTVDRRITMTNITDAGVETNFGSTSEQYEVGRWYRADVLVRSIVSGGGLLRLYIARKLVLDLSGFTTSQGLATGSTIDNTYLGCGAGTGGSNQTMIIDFDDWVCADWPTEDSGGRYTGIDWLNGSRVFRPPVTGVASGNAWTGPWQGANQLNANIFDAASRLISTVSGDALRLTVDSAKIDKAPGSIGVLCFTIFRYGAQVTAGAGTFGWKYNGLIDLAAEAEGTSDTWTRRMYRPSGLTAPIPSITPFELHKIKAANANSARTILFGVTMELCGIFGDEDVPANTVAEPDQPSAIPPRRGVHNSLYPETPWARATLPPPAPVVIHVGTYTGNGTAQELLFRVPVHWILIKPAAAPAGSHWWSSMLSGHQRGEQGNTSGLVVESRIDPTFAATGVEDAQEQRTRVTLVGGEIGWNQAAAVYEYVAFCDPGARFMVNGLTGADNSAVSTIADTIPNNPAFLPLWAFFQIAAADGSNTFNKWAKGPGHTANQASVMNLTADATGAQLAAGTVTLLASMIQSGGSHVEYSAWRKDDGSTDPNKLGVVAIGSYVGDGSATRTIQYALTGSKRPVYAMVTPSNAASIHRTPANLTNTSNAMGTGVSGTTGITAGGVDTFTVGILLNANGISYSYFVLIGSATAGNGGWSIEGEFSVIDPMSDSDATYIDPDDAIEPVEEPVEEEPDPDPGPSDVEDCEAGEVCVEATTREVNAALLEIGNTKFLTNYCTQNTLEAQVARLLYEVSVRSVLHEFPWPFATKYAALVLTAAQPDNEDWDFAYRIPVDCVFPRRLVIDRGPGVDPKGPGFELSSDSAGGILFTNEASPVLEYTCRPSCVAYTGDALFREALKWHLAAAMAPPLTRMADKAKFCREQYDLCIAKANAIIKPGQPGLRTALTGDDTGAACQTANTLVANVALLRIGANTVANLVTDQSREAQAVNLLFEHELRATLRDFPWKFAKRYNDALTTIGGTTTVPVNVDWQYSYRLPDDYVAVRRLATTGTGRSFETDPLTFEVGTDATGYLLFTGELDPNLEYTARIPCAVAKSDDLFRDALAWRLAASLAPSLAARDPEDEEARGRGPEYPPNPEQRVSHRPNKGAMRERAARYAMAMYLRVIEKARVVDANEAEPEEHGEAPWISGRD